MQTFHLSKRMLAVAGLVPRGMTACDIGCDHGFVAIYLVREGICPGVIAMDINRGPLLRAKEHIESASLSDYIDTRLSDGMEKLEAGEAECMIAAGMGGRLIVKILGDYPEKLRSLRCLVLQPQSELSFVRGFLRRQGFVIRKEDMVFEDGKFYPMMLAEVTGAEGACPGADEDVNEAEGNHKADNDTAGMPESSATDTEKGGNCSEESTREPGDWYRKSLEDEFGPCLIKERHPVLAQYLDWWEMQQNKILNAVLTYPERRAQVEEELARIRDVRKRMERGRAKEFII